MRTLVAALAAMLAATPAAALSCRPPSVEAAFSAAQDAPDIYVPVLGRFTGFAQRRDDQTVNGADRHVTARFRGHAVTAQGIGQALDLSVDLSEICLGSWCPAFAPDTPVLTFLRRDGAAYAFRVDACHGNYFASPTPSQIDTLHACLRAMACPPGN